MPAVNVPNTRPPRRITSQSALDKAEGHIRKWSNLKKYVGKLEELAAGVLLVDYQRKGHEQELILRDPETGDERVLGVGLVVYQTAPSREACQYLVDRALGKPVDRKELAGPDGGGIVIVPWMPTLASSDPDYIEGELADGN